MGDLNVDRLGELMSRKALTEAELDELLEMLKPELGEPVLSQKEIAVLTKAEKCGWWEMMEPKKQPSVLSEEEVNELLSAAPQLDFQSLAKMRKLCHLNISTKAADLVQDNNIQDNGRVENTNADSGREM